nr:MAG TPA: hypothetical protein [Caudoviricetes sp.]
MALTQTQEQALLDMLQKWTGAQERRPVKPVSLSQAVERPGTGWHVIAYDASNSNKILFRAPIPALGYSLSNDSLNIPPGQPINWNTANHLVSSKQLKALYENDVKAPLDRNTAAIEASIKANATTLSYAQGIHAVVNDHSEKIPGKLTGWGPGLVMDFGGLPSGTGASTVPFNRRFKGMPIVIVNFWGDVGNPRFSLVWEGNEVWGIRLSATYPGVWAVIGEPA